MAPTLPISPDSSSPEALATAALLDALPWGVLVLDAQHVIRRLNQQAAAWGGAPAAALLGQPLAGAALPADLRAALAQLLATGAAGADVWLPHAQQWVSLRPGPAPAGQHWVFWEDATARHQAETARQRTTQLLLDMEAVAHTGSYEADLATGSFYFSEGMYRLFGEASQAYELTLDAIDARSHPDDAAAIRQVLGEAVRTRQPYTYRRRIRRADGQWRTLEAHGEVRCDAAGTAVQLRGLVQDMTQRVQAEQELHQSRALLRRTIDSSLNLVQVFDAVRDERGAVVDFAWVLNNAAAERVYGNVIGQRLCARNPGVVAEGIFNTFKQVLETGVPDQTERHYQHEQFNGWFLQSTVRQDDGVTTTTHDITARKRTEQELQQTQQLLQTILDSSRYVVQAFAAVRNAEGRIVDFTWLLTNQVWRDSYGGTMTGKYVLQENPGVVETGLFDLFVQVTETGVPVDHEQHYAHEQFDGWFHQTLVKLGDGFVMNTVDITERRKAHEEILRLKEQLAQQATDKYLSLFNSIDSGFCIIEMLFDEAEQPYDYRFLEANPVLVQQTGLVDAIGKTVKEFVPQHEAFWFEVYGAVAKTGQPQRFEHFASHILGGVWFNVYAFRVDAPEAHHVAVLFDDITERKRRETNAALLVAITEDLNRLAGEEEMLAAVGARLAQHLDLAGWHYVDVDEARANVTVSHFWHAQDVPAMLGTYPLAGFLSPAAVARLRGGAPLVVADVPADLPADSATGAALQASAAAQQLAACIAVPYSVGGQWTAYFAVADSRPRPWTAAETALVQDVAARVFPRIERARAEAALRASEAQFRAVANLVPDLLWRSTPASDTTWYNQQWCEYTGQTLADAAGYGWTEALHPDDRAASGRRYREAVASGQPLRQEHRLRSARGEYRWFQVQARPLLNEQGTVTAWFGAATDIHDRKLAELRLRREADADAFRVRLADALRPLADVAAIQGETARLLREQLQAGWCYYNEFDETGTVSTVARAAARAGLPSFVGVHDLAAVPDYLASLRAGNILNAPDITAAGLFGQPVVARYVALGMRAALAVPLVKEGQLLATLVVADTVPREWRAEEVALLREVAERTWAAVERARAETSRRISEKRLRLLTDAMPALISYVDAGLRYRFASLHYQEWFGHAPEEVQGRLVREFLGEEAFARLRPHAEAVLAGQRQTFEAEMPFREGGTRHVHTELVPDVKPDGTVAGYYALVFDITARKQAEKARRESEEKYRTLFDSIDEGFALQELVLDADGEIADIIYREVNQAYGRQGGLTNVVGKSIKEVLPNLEQHWKDAYAQLSRTGQPVRLINYAQDVDRWFDTYLTLLGGSHHYVAVVFNDITERRRHEENLAFLAEVSDDLFQMRHPDETVALLGGKIGKKFGVAWCNLVELSEDFETALITSAWYAEGVPSLTGVHKMKDLWTDERRARHRKGEVTVVNDTQADPLVNAAGLAAMQVRSYISVPQARDGAFRFLLAIIDTAPREWRADEIKLAQELTTRIWMRLERVRAEEALRASEANYAALFAASPVPFMVVAPDAPDFTILAANEAYFATTYSTPAALIGRRMLDVFAPDPTHPGRVGSGAVADSVARVLATKQTEAMPRLRYDLVRPDGELEPRWWLAVNAPLFDAAGEVSAIIHQATNVTELYYAEVAEQERQQQQAFLLLLSDALRPLSDPLEIQRAAVRVLGEYLGVDRTLYAEVEPDDEHIAIAHNHVRGDFPAMTGRFSLRDFGQAPNSQRVGETLVLPDIHAAGEADEHLATYLAAGVQAIVGVPLRKNGRWVASLTVQHGRPRPWTPDEVALVAETAERTWAAVERAHAEQALAASEEKFRTLFETIDEGFAIVEVMPDERGQVTDMVWHEANAGVERHAGLGGWVGRRASELVPNLEQTWLDALTGVYQIGEPVRLQAYIADLDRWIDTYYARIGGAGSALIATVFNDISERKRHEQQQAFLLLLNDALRSVTNPLAIQAVVADLLGQQLNVNQAHYGEREGDYVRISHTYANGLPPMTGTFRYEDFGQRLADGWRSGQVQVCHDAATDPVLSDDERLALAAANMGAYVALPFVKNGEWVATLAVHSIGPRQWKAQEIELIRETAERTWTAVERARAEEALAASEQRLRALITNLPGAAAFVVGPDLRYQLAGGEALDAAGLTPADLLGRTIAEAMPPDLVPQYEAHYRQALAGQGFSREHTAHGHTFISRGVPLLDAAGQPEAVLVVSYDISARKQAEEALRASQEKLALFNARLEDRVARRTRDLQASRDLLQSVFDTNLIAMSVLEAVRDAAGTILDFRLRLVSRELARETGRADLPGLLYAEQFPGIREVGIFDLLVRTVETGEPQGMEYFYAHEGFDKWFACQFVKLGDGVVATNLDITPRKTAEQERFRNLQLLEQAEAVAGLGSWDYDLRSQSFQWSAGMYQLFGLPPEKAVRPDVYQRFVVADDHARAAQLVERLTTGTANFEDTLRLRVDGQLKTVRIKAVVLRNEAGRPVRVLGVDLDISELQRLEADNLRLRLTQQRALFEAVQAAQEAERKRMAESLHNGIGQILYATKLRIDRLHTPLLGTAPALVKARAEADQLLGEAIRQTRALSHELVPMVLEEFGLAAALQDIAAKMSMPRLRLRSYIELDEAATSLGPALQMALYRMAQELAQNIIKHAHGATMATLELETTPGWVLLRAEDNGAGFPAAPAEPAGLGLRSIRDRVALLGGQLETGAAAGGGAYVRIRIPLPESATP